jgi:chemotaxis protein MotA
MDIASIIGVALTFILVFSPIIMSGMLMSFIDIGSILIVVGGSIAAVFTAYPLVEVLSTIKVIKKVFFAGGSDPKSIINTLVDLGEKARREGILALERELKSIDDEFLRKAIQFAVDGNEIETIEAVMNSEIDAIEERHKVGKSILENMATFAPGFGMLGTLIGLIQMLQNLSDPSNIGAGMAVALITTFYGSLLANGLWTPMAVKLERRSKEELILKQLVLAGIVSIQSGDNPRVLRDKLETFIAPGLREPKS